MMRRPPPRPGVGKKSSSSGFKVTYSVNQLLTMGKELLSEEPVCPPPEGWEKYQFDKIGPLHQDDANSRPAHASPKDYLATLVLRPGSARDLHAGHLDALANKQAQEPDRSPVLGSRGGGGGGSRGAGLGWGDRDRDRDRYDRNKERDRGLSRFDHDRDRRGDGGRRDRARDVQQPSNRPPSRWDALKPDRDRDRGYNNRNNRDSRDRDDGDELGAGGLSRQDARLGGGRDRDRDGRNTRSGGDSLRDGGLAAHDRALASERASGAAGSKEKERERSVGSGAGTGRDRFGGGGGISNEADIWDMPTSALPGGDDKKGASKDPPRNSRAAGLRSAEREQREKDRREEEAREFQATKLMFERERAAFKQQGQQKGAASGDGAAVSNGDATDFPDMGGGFLDSSDSSNQDGNNINGKDDSDLLGNGALDKRSPSTPAGDKAGEDLSAKRDEESNDRKGKEETRRGSFLGDLLGGGGRAGDSSGGEGNGLQGGGTATAEGGGEGKGGRGRGGTGGAFPGQGLFSFMPPGSSISTIDKFTEVTRGGASKIFSPDGMIDGTGITRLSPWEKTENKTAKAAASPPPTVTGGGGTSGEGSSASSLSAAEKSAILKRMIMGGGGGATRGPGAIVPALNPTPAPTPLPQPDSHGRAASVSGGNDREGGAALWKNGGVPVKALQPQPVGGEGGAGGAAGPLRGASTAEVDMLMKKLAVAHLPEDQRREAFKQTQWQKQQQQLQQEKELRQHYKQQQLVVGDQPSPLLRTSQPPLAPFGSPSHSVMIGQPEPPVGPSSLQSGMTSLSPPLGGIAYRPGLQMTPTGGGGTGGTGGGGGLMPPPSKVPTNDGQHPQLGADMATVEEFRRLQVQQQQQRRHQQELHILQQQQQQRHREMERHVDQYRQLQMQQHQKKLEQRRLEQERIEQQRLELQRMEIQRVEQQRLEQNRLEQRRLEQQRQQDLRHRQEQQLEQQQAALRQRQQQQQQQRRYATEVTGVPPGSGAPMIHQQHQQQLMRQRQLQLQHQQQQQMHIRQQHPHSQHLSRGAATVSGGRGMQGLPLGATLLQQQQQQQQQRRQLVGENSSEGAPHMLSPMGGPMMMTGVHPSARQSQQQGGGEYSSLAAGGHLQQRIAPQQQPPPTHSPPSMARGASGVSDSSTANMFNSAEFPSRTRADVDLLSVLGLQKTPADQGAGHSSYGGGGDLSGTGGGGGGGHHFAFHEPQPGARRTRATNGMSGSMALDPRARARVGAVPGIGVGGRKVGLRPGAPAGQITADEMERMVNGN